VRQTEGSKGNCVCSAQYKFKRKLNDDSNSYTSCHLCGRREGQSQRENTAAKDTSLIAGNFPLCPTEMTQCLLFTKPNFVLTEQVFWIVVCLGNCFSTFRMDVQPLSAEL
jgi:hypothetical protein